MFFDLELLCRQGRGKFALAWIAATRGIAKLSKQQVLETDICRLCEEINAMIISDSKRPRARVSLSLAAKLVHGTVIIHRQKAVLLTGKAVEFLCLVRRPLIEKPLIVPVPKAKSKRKREVVLSQEIEAPAEAAAAPIPGELAITDADVIEALRVAPTADTDLITLREEIPPRTIPRDQEEPFGDEGYIGMQLFLLEHGIPETAEQTAQFQRIVFEDETTLGLRRPGVHIEEIVEEPTEKQVSETLKVAEATDIQKVVEQAVEGEEIEQARKKRRVRKDKKEVGDVPKTVEKVVAEKGPTAAEIVSVPMEIEQVEKAPAVIEVVSVPMEIVQAEKAPAVIEQPPVEELAVPTEVPAGVEKIAGEVEIVAEAKAAARRKPKSPKKVTVPPKVYVQEKPRNIRVIMRCSDVDDETFIFDENSNIMITYKPRKFQNYLDDPEFRTMFQPIVEESGQIDLSMTGAAVRASRTLSSLTVSVDTPLEKRRLASERGTPQAIIPTGVVSHVETELSIEPTPKRAKPSPRPKISLIEEPPVPTDAEKEQEVVQEVSVLKELQVRPEIIAGELELPPEVPPEIPPVIAITKEIEAPEVGIIEPMIAEQTIEETLPPAAQVPKKPRKEEIVLISPTDSTKRLQSAKMRYRNIVNIVKNWNYEDRELTIEDLCSRPLIRFNLAVTFADLLALSKMNYVKLENKPYSIELGYIKKGSKLTRQ